MKQKTQKITSKSLFIYKQGKSKVKHSDTTDTTITVTTLTGTTGVFYSK